MASPAHAQTMKPRSALVVALLCGGVAVLVVSLDLAFNVDVSFEAKASDGSWQVQQTTKSQTDYARGPVCAEDYRLTVHNGMPWSSTVAITIQRGDTAPVHQSW